MTVFVLASFSAYGQTLTSSTNAVCEGDPVQLEVTGLDVGEDGMFQWFVNGQKYKVTTLGHCSVESAEFSGDGMTVGVAKYPSSSPTVTKELASATNCKSTICREAATGEYIFGTDFDYNGSCNPVTQSCLVHQFPDGVKFNSAGKVDGNAEFLKKFGSLPRALQGKDNNYLFINENHKFTIDFNNCPYFKKGPFRLFVRVYAKFSNEESCSPVFNDIKLDGKYGNQANDQYLSTSIYNDTSNVLVFQTYKQSNNQPQIEAKQQNRGPESGRPFKKGVLYKMDIELGGYFTRFDNANASIDFILQQSNCLEIAIDFISFESENVCVTPRVACVGDSVTVATAGFASGKQITWQMYNESNGKWESIPGIKYQPKQQLDPTSGNYVSVNVMADIPMTKIGAGLYRVTSSYGYDAQGKELKSEVEFTLVGEDCAHNACVSIGGDTLACLLADKTELPFTLLNTDVLDSYYGDKNYEWLVYGPEGDSLNGDGITELDVRRDFSEKEDENSAFHKKYNPNKSNDQGLNVYLDTEWMNQHRYFSEDKNKKKYKIEVIARNAGNSEICRTHFDFRVLRDPRLRKFKLEAPSVTGRLCAADFVYYNDKSVELQVLGEKVVGEASLPNPYNGFGYKYTWTDATKSTKEWEATLNVDKSKACNGIDKKYTPEVEIDNLGCKAKFKIELEVENPEMPTILCPETEDVVLELGPNYSDPNTRDYKLPVLSSSSYSVACGSATIEVIVDGKNKTMGSTVALAEGTHTVIYKLTDGCEKVVECSYKVKVIAGIPPTLDCSQIGSISRDVDACDAYIKVNVPDVSQITEEERVTVTFYGYKESKDNPGKDPNKYEAADKVPMLYNVGNTYLLWAFADTAGNTAYCTQLIEINDNRPFDLTCNTSLTENDTINVCDGKTWAEIQAADPDFKAKFPTASYTQCGTSTDIVIAPTLSYKLATETTYKPLNNETLLYNKVYNIRWTFTKAGDNIVTQTQYCYASIVLLDNEPPTIDCSKFENATVLVNYNPDKGENASDKYMKYASARKGAGEGAGYIYTLAGKLKFPTAEDISDNCTDPTQVNVEVKIGDDIIANDAALQQYQFKVGDAGQATYIIHFTFTDEAGNVARCQQEIEVVESFKPVPNCPADETLVASDPSDCSASYSYTETPKARMDYWKYEKEKVGPGAGPADLDAYNALHGTVSHEQTEIYPYKLVSVVGGVETLITENNSTPEIVEARYLKEAGPAGTSTWWNSNNNPDKVNKVYKKDFTSADKARITAAFSDLSIGVHTYRWYFRNNDNKEASCDFVVTVEDKTAPSFNCHSNVTISTASNASACSATFNMKTYQPTEVKDCDTKLSYAYEIRKDGVVFKPRRSFTYGSNQNENLNKGTYTIVWYVSDSKGNEDQCSFDLTVEDKTNPTITCPGAVSLDATSNCEVSYTVAKSKFTVSDNCDDVIIYSYSIDGEAEVLVPTHTTTITIPALRVGKHTIVWTAKDLSDNTATCEQEITVNDDEDYEILCPENLNPHVQTCADKLKWSDLKPMLSGLDALPTGTSFFNCVTKKTTLATEIIEYKESSATNYSSVQNGTEFQARKTYNIRFTYKKEGSFINTKEKTCEISVYIGDKESPTFLCSEMDAILTLDVVKACDTSYVLIPPKNAVSDVCTTNKDDFKWYYTLGNKAEKLWTGTTEKLNVGTSYTVVWRVEDKDGNSSENTCSQTIRVRDKRHFDLVCPSDNDIKFNWCDYQYWYTEYAGRYSVRDTLLKNPNQWPKASALVCKNGKPSTKMDLDSTVYFYPDKNGKWGPVEDLTMFTYGVQYKIKWVYSTPKDIYTEVVSDSCEVSFKITDTESPTADCSKMKHKDVFIKSQCDTTFLLSEPTGVFKDNCDLNGYAFKWKFENGADSPVLDYNEENATLTFKPGVYTITWWALDKEDNISKESCDQEITVRDSAALKVTCPENDDKIYNIESCTTPSGSAILDSLEAVSFRPKAEYARKCWDASHYPAIQETVYAKKSGATSWKLLSSISSLDLKGVYDIRWVFSVKKTNYVADLADTCEFKIRIGDVTPPTFDCPKDATVKTTSTDKDCEATYELELSTLNIQDKCSGSDLRKFDIGYFVEDLEGMTDTVFFEKETTKASIKLPVREDPYVIAWVVKDEAGNRRDECKNEVTVKDNTKPIIDCPADMAIKLTTQCDTTMTITAPAVTDNCSGNITFTYKIEGASVDGSAKTGTYKKPFNFTFKLGETTITWTAKDEANNKSVACVRTYTLTDKTGFNFTCPDLKDVIIDTCLTINWETLKPMIPVEQTPNAVYLNCKENQDETIVPTITYKKRGTSSYADLTDDVKFEYGNTYDLVYLFTKSGENIETLEERCTISVSVKDTSAPIFDCDKVDDIITLNVVNACDSSYVLEAPKAAVSDTCTKNADEFQFFYSIDGKAKKQWTATSSETFKVGKEYILVWSVKDAEGNSARNTCEQKIVVNDKRKINLKCPSVSDITFNWCDTGEDYLWQNEEYSIKDTLLKKSNHWPKASATLCEDGSETTTAVDLDSVIYVSSDKGSTWTELTESSTFKYNHEYQIKWVYVKKGDFFAEVKDSCTVNFQIKDIENPKANCTKMENYDVFITSTACDTSFLLREPVGVFSDNCGTDHAGFKLKFDAGEGAKVYNATDGVVTFVPGVHVIKWWAEDKENLKSPECEQTIVVRDSAMLKVSCPDTEDKIYDVQACTTPSGTDILDSLKLVSYKPKAEFIRKCGDEYPTITETVYAKKSGTTAWKKLSSLTTLDLKSVYDIRWIFSTMQTNFVAALADTCEFQVRIGDVTKPEFICPPTAEAITSETDANCVADMFVDLSAFGVTDNCETDPADFKYGYFIQDFSTDTVYVPYVTTPVKVSMPVRDDSYVVVWAVEDKAGNRAECEQTVKALDKTKPIINCPKDTSVQLIANCDTTMIVVAPAVKDNCSGDITFTYKIGDADAVEYNDAFGYQFNLGETKITWIAKDAANNVSEACVRTYTLTDKTGFNFTCPRLNDVIIDECETLEWSRVKTLIPDDQTPNAVYLDCKNNKQETIVPTITYKERSATSYADLTDDVKFEYGTTYDLIYFFKKEGENVETLERTCSISVVVKDTSVPLFDCEKVDGLITLDVENGCDVLYTLSAPKEAVSDICTKSDDDFNFSYSIDGAAMKSWTVASSETFNVGQTYQITWSVKDAAGNEARNTCSQSVVVNDKRKIDLTCSSVADITFNWCDTGNDYLWKGEENSIKDTLLNKSNHWPKASATKCEGGEETKERVELDSTIYISSNQGVTWTEMMESTPFKYGTDYQIKWVYVKKGDYFAEVQDSCTVDFRIKDVENPKADCSKMEDYDVFITSASCDTTFLLHEPTGVFTDNCGVDHYGFTVKFDDGEASGPKIYNEVDANLTFKPGKYTITWWAEDKEDLKSPECIQTIIVRDSFLFKVTCPDDEEDKVFDVQTCEAPSGEELLDSLTKASYKPYAEFLKNCEGFSYPTINETVYIRKKGEESWSLLKNVAKLALKENYQIRWVFSVEQTDQMAAMADSSCEYEIRIGDVTIPEFTCPTETVAKTDKDAVDCMAKMSVALSEFQPTDNCEKNPDDFTYGYFIQDFSTDTTYVAYSATPVVVSMPVREDPYKVVWVVADKAGNRAECEQKVQANDSTRPSVVCPEPIVENLTSGCSMDMVLTPATANDNCSVADIFYSLDGEKFEKVTEEPINATFAIGVASVYWYSADVQGNVSDTCLQTVTVNDNEKFDIHCPQNGDDTFIIEACQDLTWKDVRDSLTRLDMNASAEYVDCKTNTSTPLDSVIMKISLAGTEAWTLMTETTDIKKDTEYNIRWIFTKYGEDIITQTDSCQLAIMLKDTTLPVFDCLTIDPDSLVQVVDGVCEVPFQNIQFNDYEADDNCDGKVKGVLSWSEDMADRIKDDELFKVGELYKMHWIFQDRTGNQITCDQKLMLNSNLKPVFDCDSLHKAPIDTVLHGVCEIAAADLNINTPFALDACTKDTILGVPTRKSGKSMEDSYVVGRDTIVWVFDSKYSTLNDTCEQYVFIQSDMKPVFDCDSLHNAPIDTLLHGVCEISPADLNINTPFALDACTKDTILGVPTRKSGRSMEENFVVGRDTIVWVFDSEYSTLNDTCEQYVFIQSDLKPLFDCDSLHNAPIDTVLHGVCEISPADLNINTPFALDACTKDTILGVPTRKSGKTMEENFVVGRDTIVWVFDSEYSTMNDTCEQYVFIQSDLKPLFDCDSLHNAPIDTVLHGVCEISPSDLNINTPFALDACTKDTILGVPTRKSGKTMEENFVVGRDTIVWVFDSEYSTLNDTCEQYVFIQSDLKPVFNCDSLNNSPIEKVLNGVCEISAADLNVNVPVARDACTNVPIPGVGRRTSGRSMEDSYVVGRDTIVWYFESEYSTETDSCRQYVFLQSDIAPKFDCDSLRNTPIVKALDLNVCEISPEDLNINTPFALDACTNDTIWGIGRRVSGKAMTDVYKIGRDTIVWKFVSEYSTKEDSCEQYVIIKDTIAPPVDCSIFEDVAIVWTELGDEVPYEKVVAEGMVVNPSVMDVCDGEIFGTPSRSDGLALEAPFALDTTTVVTWTFVDASGNDTSCSQNIHITNLVEIPIECPVLQKTVYSCIEELPAPYSTWSEFKAAGGSAVLEKFLDFSTFGSVDTVSGKCTKEVKRTYFIYNLKGMRSSCDQIFTIVDTLAPVITTEVENLVLGCKDDIPEAPQVYATDACQEGEILAAMVETNDRSTDPHSCGYYNYTITRTWQAVDSCGNFSLPLVQTITVVDTINPYFDFPDNWKDTVLAIMFKGCHFEIPDFSSAVRSIVQDNCTETDDLTIQQFPTAGTQISESQFVRVYVSDFCGNRDSLDMYVMVSAPKTIVSLAANSLTTCVSDTTAISLWSQNVRVARGSLFIEDWDGSITTIPSTFTYDCYLGSISDSTLVFSDNPNTNARKFYNSDRDAYNRNRDSLINLTRRSQSGLYYFVAMDTITLCSDTASAYLDLREKPRISMESGDFSVCEYDSLPLNQILTQFGVCIDDMGYPLTEEGWMIDGVKYTTSDSVFTASDRLSLYYYAENECGMTNSLDSYFGACFTFPVGADSVEVFGSELNAKLFREERLKVSSSIVLDVHRRFDANTMMLTSDPPAPATLFEGDNAKLILNTDQKPSHIDWYRVVGNYDARFGNRYDIDGTLKTSESVHLENDDELIDVTDSTEAKYMQQFLYNLSDSANYYVVVSDYVCPSMSSNVLSINVNNFIPTAFTPYDRDGMNDVFMPNAYVVIFNRYGQKVHEGMGWDGSYDGAMADPGVFFYELVLPNGKTRQGTIEVVKM
ncbi:MAG: Ig-like domain repeat protein [Paludibacteraceae bacterium]|nr:Ig-like domain repeat protein [Paludibacteraceae bacterium]